MIDAAREIERQNRPEESIAGMRLREAAEVIGEARWVMMLWATYHDVRSYVVYTTAINATQNLLAKLKGGPS